MNQKDVLELAKKICNQYGYKFPEIKFSKRLITTTGKCWLGGPIILSSKFCEINDEIVVDSLLKHEIAHLNNNNHGSRWKDEVKRMDTIPEFSEDKVYRFVNSTMKFVDDDKYPYKYVCDKGHLTTKKKPIKDLSLVSCGGCSKKYDKRFQLKQYME